MLAAPLMRLTSQVFIGPTQVLFPGSNISNFTVPEAWLASVSSTLAEIDSPTSAVAVGVSAIVGSAIAIGSEVTVTSRGWSAPVM